MSTTARPAVDLIRHSSVASPEPHSIRVDYECAADVLRLRYSLLGTLSRLRVPQVRAAERTGDLWRHTCCEAFLGFDGAPVYYEFNFAPSTQWAVLRFASYRNGKSAVERVRTPVIEVRREPERLQLDVTVTLAELGELIGDTRLKLGLAAVVEAQSGTLSYWALKHPRDHPDFHHPDSFTITLR